MVRCHNINVPCGAIEGSLRTRFAPRFERGS